MDDVHGVTVKAVATERRGVEIGLDIELHKGVFIASAASFVRNSRHILTRICMSICGTTAWMSDALRSLYWRQ